MLPRIRVDSTWPQKSMPSGPPQFHCNILAHLQADNNSQKKMLFVGAVWHQANAAPRIIVRGGHVRKRPSCSCKVLYTQCSGKQQPQLILRRSRTQSQMHQGNPSTKGELAYSRSVMCGHEALFHSILVSKLTMVANYIYMLTLHISLLN